MAQGALQGECLVAWPHVGVAHPPGPWPYDRYVHAKHPEAKKREYDSMAEDRTAESTPGRITRTGSDELEASRAAQAGADFDWHFGRVTSLGTIAITDSRTVTILWEEGGISSQQGELTDEQWEIFKLAFVSTGRIAILSDQPAKDWMYDYRFLEAVRW
jgi:hypothetical protein